MKNTFKIGDKVKVVSAGPQSHIIGQVGVVKSLGVNCVVYLDFPDPNSKWLPFFEGELELVQEPNKNLEDTETIQLTQVIINTKGEARLVKQKRDSLGRFIPGAVVSGLSSPQSLYPDVKGKTVVFVQHNYSCRNKTQSVTSVSRETGKGNIVSFINDGLGTKKHASFFS